MSEVNSGMRLLRPSGRAAFVPKEPHQPAFAPGCNQLTHFALHNAYGRSALLKTRSNLKTSRHLYGFNG
jgi:hypothetical protein